MKLIETAFVIFLGFAINASLSQAIEFHADAVQTLHPNVTYPKNWDGAAAISLGCSASVIQFNDDLTKNAVILSNGHCYDEKMPAGKIDSNIPYSEPVRIFSSNGKSYMHSLTRIIFATLTKTDVALYESDVTYAELQSEGIHPFTLSAESATVGDAIELISGYMEQEQNCTIGTIVHELKEATIVTLNAYRYQGCNSIPGWSGTPMIAKGTHVIVGVNNTHYSGGTECTLDNPCEVDANGNITTGPTGTSYGQQTALLLSCINATGDFDLSASTCTFHSNP